MARRIVLLLLTPILLILILLILFIGLLQSVDLLTLNFGASLVEIGAPLEIARLGQDINQIFIWLNWPFRILFVPLIFIIALIFHLLNWRIAGWFLDSMLIHSVRRPQILIQDDSLSGDSQESAVELARHRQTMQYLIASFISLAAFSIAVLLTLLQFINTAGLAIIVTVASTALGFGARDYINDLIMGVTDIFENNFNVGEKIEILRQFTHLEGVVKKVNVRTTTLQTPEGIPVTIPHGEMRVLRNFSRGHYSFTSIVVPVPTKSLTQTLQILEDFSSESKSLFPDLIEPLQIIGRNGVIGSQTELLVLGKAVYRQGAGLRLKLFTEIQERLKLVQS